MLAHLHTACTVTINLGDTNTLATDVSDRCDVPGSVDDNTKNSNSAANVPVGLYYIMLMKIATGRAL